jgi:hypothetical protein
VLRGLWLTCVLVLASASARAQPAPETAKAQAAVTTDEQKLATVAASRAKIAQRYQDQLVTIDRLKKEKASWRRDRELRTSLADSGDTANQLAAQNQQVATANAALVKARRELVAAIDREQKTATGARATELAKLRAQVESKLGAPAKKIVLPDAEIDPSADPEDLDEQAQVIAETEKQLANQVAGLDEQAAELAHVADLRKHNERAKDLMLSEDDQPHRNAQASTGTRQDGALSQPVPGNPTGGGTGGGSGAGGDTTFDHGGSFETEATFVLGEVIDRSTIDGLTRAQRSGDPAKRAEAAKQVRDAVAVRLDQLRKKRTEIEQRAKHLRRIRSESETPRENLQA